jgi:exodeoxyribonuclease III
MSFTVATWNINSVRLRIDQVTRFLKMKEPDVLCLQETKCPNDLFPKGAFQKIGYGNLVFSGQKGYNGVAIISKHKIENAERMAMCGRDDARHIGADVIAGGATLRIQNFYVPAGGDIANPDENPKFAHKLAFLAELQSFSEVAAQRKTEVVVGDLNIAPLEHDVWSHKQLLDVVSHTPIETQFLERIRRAGNFVDTARQLLPEPQKLYSWWSYRAADWAMSDRGRRLDHIWTSGDLSGNLSAVEFFRQSRGWEKPSDHVPVILTLKQ